MGGAGRLDLEEAKESLSKVKLHSVRLGGFLVVLRDDFDVTISGEPFVAYVLLCNLESGLYLARIWNQTVASGYVSRWLFKNSLLSTKMSRSYFIPYCVTTCGSKMSGRLRLDRRPILMHKKSQRKWLPNLISNKNVSKIGVHTFLQECILGPLSV